MRLDILKKELRDDEILKYYRIKDSRGNRMVSEAELSPNTVNYECIYEDDIRSEILRIEKVMFPNNNVFITVGKKYILIMNKFYEDELKTKYIPKNKKQLKNHYKFTTWVLTREYVQKCIDILIEFSKSGSAISLFKIENVHALYKLTSMIDGDVIELDKHVQLHTEYIKTFIIAKDKYKCKDAQPEIVIAPSSDISASIMHIHFMIEIIHDISFKKINYRIELLKTKSLLYDSYTVNVFRLNKLLNKFKTNKLQTIDNCFQNPFIVALKLSHLLQLPIS